MTVTALLNLPTACAGPGTKDADDIAYNNMPEGTHTVGEVHLPLSSYSVAEDAVDSTIVSSEEDSSRASNSTVGEVFLDALEAVTNSSAALSEPAICPTLVVPADYTPNGEGPRTGSPVSHIVRSIKSLEKPQKERVLILAANSGGSCSLRLGDYYNFLSLLDKLQYGNVHGYDVLLGMGNVDDDLRKTWNKVAWMQKVSFARALLIPCISRAHSVRSHQYTQLRIPTVSKDAQVRVTLKSCDTKGRGRSLSRPKDDVQAHNTSGS